MYSNLYNVSSENFNFCSKLMKEYAEIFTFEPRSHDKTVDLITEYKKILSSRKYINSVCVYQYNFFDKPLYIGVSTNGHANRFYKQLRGLYDRSYNRKNQLKLYTPDNIREAWVEKVHTKKLNIESMSLRILSLEPDSIGHQNFEELLDLAYHYGYSINFFEQIMLNHYYIRGEDEYILNSQKPNYSSWLNVDSKSTFVSRLKNEAYVNKGVDWSEFMAC